MEKQDEHEKTAELRVLTEKQLETIRKLRPMDDAFMRALFHEDPALSQELIRSVPGYEEVSIVRAETQKDMPFINGAHGLRLDIWGEGSDKSQYSFEIQRAEKGADPRRPRYVHSVIDVGTLDKGEDFTRLPKTAVIFLTEEDIFGDGLLFHRFQWHDKEHSLDLDTGQTVIYVYVGGKAKPGQQKLAALAEDMLQANPDKMQTPALADKARFLKTTKKGQEKMSDIMMEYTKEAREEAERAKAYEIIRSLRAETDWSIERIAKVAKLTVGEVEEALSEKTA